jgi:hypothetical protein
MTLSTLLDRWLDLQPEVATRAIEGGAHDRSIEFYVLATLFAKIDEILSLRTKLEHGNVGWTATLVDYSNFDATFEKSGDTPAEALLAAYLAWLEVEGNE